MNIQQAYNQWSEIYDTNDNKTRDLEAKALRASILPDSKLDILEIGCGTGKNTEYLLTQANKLIGADFSTEMLSKAKQKITAQNVEFRQMDLRESWDFAENSFDLITSMSVVEHIPDDKGAIQKMWHLLKPGGVLLLSVPCAVNASEEYTNLNDYELIDKNENGFVFWQR